MNTVHHVYFITSNNLLHTYNIHVYAKRYKPEVKHGQVHIVKCTL